MSASQTAPAMTSSRSLSPREAEVLRLLASGLSNREIAGKLFLSVRTVERHITNIYGKISARGKADATAFAIKSGMV
jgi:DNA-binding NarL/FixJ family response regulator